MKIVINIPDEMYKWINDANKIFTDYGVNDFIDLVKNGTPIPRGCGRLIDADALDSGIREQQKSYKHTLGVRQLINEAVSDGITIARTYIKYAPIIIEADRGKGQK